MGGIGCSPGSLCCACTARSRMKILIAVGQPLPYRPLRSRRVDLASLARKPQARSWRESAQARRCNLGESRRQQRFRLTPAPVHLDSVHFTDEDRCPALDLRPDTDVLSNSDGVHRESGSPLNTSKTQVWKMRVTRELSSIFALGIVLRVNSP